MGSVTYLPIIDGIPQNSYVEALPLNVPAFTDMAFKGIIKVK